MEVGSCKLPVKGPDDPLDDALEAVEAVEEAEEVTDSRDEEASEDFLSSLLLWDMLLNMDYIALELASLLSLSSTCFLL